MTFSSPEGRPNCQRAWIRITTSMELTCSLVCTWPVIGMSVPLFILAANLCRLVGDGIKSPEEHLDTIMRQRMVSGQMESIYQPVLEQLLNPKNKISVKRACSGVLRDFRGYRLSYYAPLSPCSWKTSWSTRDKNQLSVEETALSAQSSRGYKFPSSHSTYIIPGVPSRHENFVPCGWERDK